MTKLVMTNNKSIDELQYSYSIWLKWPDPWNGYFSHDLVISICVHVWLLTFTVIFAWIEL